MQKFLEWLTHISPANKAMIAAVVLMAFGLFHEIGGFQIQPDMGRISLALGTAFTLIWLLMVFKPPPPQNRRGSDKDRKKPEP